MSARNRNHFPPPGVKKMKKVSVVIAALAWAGLAQAGEYHRMGQLRCTDCHTMHASRQHSMKQDGTGVTGIGAGMNANTGTPNDRLLVANGVNATCLACHDGQPFAPDVLGANGGSVAAGTRSAGFLNDVAEGAPLTNYGHTLETTATPPGFAGAFAWGGQPMECENCHAVHGSRAYRNAGLGRVAISQGATTATFANVGATYTFVAAGAVDESVDVAVDSSDGAAHPALSVVNGTISNTFETAKIRFGKGSGNATNALFTGLGMAGVTAPKTLAPNGMNAYCATCHGNFHGDTNTKGTVVGTTQHYIRHPTSGVVRGTGTDTTFTGAFTGVKDTDPSVVLNNVQGDLVRAVFTANNKGAWEVGCLTCHKAHGNDRPFGLIFPSHIGAVADYENGDSAVLGSGDYPIRNLCISCHGMGKNY